jgi:hypothetical protein
MENYDKFWEDDSGDSTESGGRGGWNISSGRSPTSAAREGELIDEVLRRYREQGKRQRAVDRATSREQLRRSVGDSLEQLEDPAMSPISRDLDAA